MTQFGRAMHELGIELIKAYSPQAKGRIERLWRTFQDRLIAELRLHEVQTIKEANLYLKGFLRKFNNQFRVKAQMRTSCFKESPYKAILDDILCLKEVRTVNNDNTISYQNQIYKIARSSSWKTYAKKKVEVWDRQDGIIKVALDGQILQVYKPIKKGNNHLNLAA